MSIPRIEYVQGAELPDALCRWAVTDPIDFSTGWTFSLKVGPRIPAAATFTKTTGFIGGTNEVRVVWADTGEVGSLAPGIYTFDLTCTFGTKQRRHLAQLVILPALA